ncbi:hypothetical protein ACIBKX_20470 [Streptomyces sp. NPDC050658]|uniref:hypothetical protein n=1 Tax=unclassified Streptomyces TaxID=2593676 RepID=UPI00344148DF
MKTTFRRVAATAMLTLAVAVPLTTTAQAAEVPAKKVTSHPCDWHGCWHHHDHDLLDVDLGIGLL